ncbi:MAG: GHMP kinase [Actinomycetota bacterium]
MIHHAAPARVGILGNPSDGYGGRTLALAVQQFEASVTLEPAEGIELVGAPDDDPCWPSLAAMTDHVDRHGYGTGPQLLAATVRTFASVAASLGIPMDEGCRLQYRTSIPRQVGLGGSSALVVATLRCLCEHYGMTVPSMILPSIALSVETDQLGISAGLQDRVVQTYGGLVAMDFGDAVVDTRFGVSHGTYEPVDPSALPPLFLAFRESAAEPSTDYHRQLRARFDAGDSAVRDTLRELAALVIEGRAALRWGDGARFGALIGRNMTLRRSLGPLPEAQLELVDVAESLETHATFAGSGGAVVGCFTDADHAEELADAYADIGADFAVIDATASSVVAALTDDEPDDSNVVALQPRRG